MTAKSTEKESLLASGRPLVFNFTDQPQYGFVPVQNRHGQSIRLWGRSLSLMQKEAIVRSPQSSTLWRLSSDEGPYLKGYDSAPCPLAFFTTGLVASCMSETLALASARRIVIDNIVLVLDNFYSMNGSAVQGTMRGGASNPLLKAWIESSADDETLAELLRDAVQASPVYALVRDSQESLFTLTVNGATQSTDRVRTIKASDNLDAELDFGLLKPERSEPEDDVLVRKLTDIETRHGVAGGYATSLAASQDRDLHIRGTCRLLDDGTKEIHQDLFSPLGSSFRFISDENPEFGGSGKAPNAASYAAAGIAFCFMTQLGRYARITRQKLTDYRVIQDVHFSIGGGRGRCDAVETHVHLNGPIEPEFARKLLDMGEQTCFLHALCRSDLDIDIEWQRGSGPPAHSVSDSA